MAVTGGYRNTYVDTSNQTNYTFNNVDIGTAAADRYVVIVVMRNVATSAVTSLTVGGNSATKVAEDATSGTRGVDIWLVLVTTGTTATVQVNKDAVNGYCVISSYAFFGMDPTPVATGGTGDTTAPIGMNLNVISGGVVIAGARCQDGNFLGALTCTWTGLTENVDAGSEGFNSHSAASLLITATESPRTVSAAWAGTASNPRGCAVSFQAAVIPGHPYQKRTGGVPFMGAKGGNRFGGGAVWMPERRLLLPERIAA